jgi:hypothetical protein
MELKRVFENLKQKVSRNCKKKKKKYSLQSSTTNGSSKSQPHSLSIIISFQIVLFWKVTRLYCHTQQQQGQQQSVCRAIKIKKNTHTHTHFCARAKYT